MFPVQFLFKFLWESCEFSKDAQIRCFSRDVGIRVFQFCQGFGIDVGFRCYHGRVCAGSVFGFCQEIGIKNPESPPDPPSLSLSSFLSLLLSRPPLG